MDMQFDFLRNYQFGPAMTADVPRYVDMLESLRRGVDVLYDSPEAMLIHQPQGACTLGATDSDAARHALDAALPTDVSHLVVRDEALLAYVRERFGLEGHSRCVQICYEGIMPVVEGPMVIRHPTAEDWDAVRATYDLVDDEHLYRHFVSDDFFCGYVDGHLAAYVGLHTEGAMGMLYVFPDYRRRGLAAQMVSFFVRRQLSLGRFAYAHVFEDNFPSLALQRKMGMTFSSSPIWWTWPGD